MHEWSLLIFTICMQAAIGLLFSISLLKNKFSQLTEQQQISILKSTIIVAAICSISGLIASFTHLGTPSKAINTILNFGNSWMSNEIVVTAIFIGLVFISVFNVFIQKKINFNIILLAAVVGLVDIFCMAKIYSTSLVDGWSSLNTFTSFYGTALVLGILLFVVLVQNKLKKINMSIYDSIVKWAFIVSIIGIMIQVIGVVILSVQGVNPIIIDAITWTDLIAPYVSTLLIRWLIEIIGIGLIGYLVFSNKKINKVYFAYGAFLLVTSAEIMNRYIFYVMGS